MSGRLDLETLKGLIENDHIDTVLVCMVDMQGRLIGKRVTGHFFLESVVDEMHACDYLLALDMDMEPVPGYEVASWDRGYGDFVVKPDLSTLRRIPWLEATALVLGDVFDHHGAPAAHSPRQMLRQQCERAAALGYTVKAGSELELYLFDDSFEAAHGKRYHDLKTAGWYIEDYHILQTTKEEPLVRAIRNGMDGAGVPVEFSKGEWGPGQEEINLRYAEAMEMADRHSIYKNGAKEIAWQQGKAITFMAKWNYALAGNSCHIHMSLWDKKTDKPLFGDEKADDGMTPLFRRFLAGLLACGEEITYFLAPCINSYKRFQAGSFAPTRLAWSRDNRTAGFRLVGHGPSLRVECRVPGADVNPYLAYAAMIAAGLYGIENELELEAAHEGNIYQDAGAREVPKTLRAALAALDSSSMLRQAFGDKVVEHYLHTGRWEQFEYDRRVTDWELVRGFERA